MLIFLKYTIALIFVLSSFSLLAEPEQNGTDTDSLSLEKKQIQKQPIEEDPGKSLLWMEQKQREWSGDIVNVARYLDRLMGDLGPVQDNNESYVKVYLGFEESRLFDFEEQLTARFSLDLPLIKKKLRLIVENDDAVFQDDFSNETELVGKEALEDESVYASFRQVFTSKDWRRLSFDYGVKVRLKPDLFTRARAVRVWPLSDTWSFRFSEDLFWFESIGLGAKTNLDFDHRSNREFLQRIGSYVHWYERENRFILGQEFSLFHDYSTKRAMQYAVGYSANHQSDHCVLSNYYTKIRYRRNIYDDWLFYQVSTGVEFPREKDYRTNPFIGVRLEILFTESVDRQLTTRMY